MHWTLPRGDETVKYRWKWSCMNQWIYDYTITCIFSFGDLLLVFSFLSFLQNPVRLLYQMKYLLIHAHTKLCRKIKVAICNHLWYICKFVFFQMLSGMLEQVEARLGKDERFLMKWAGKSKLSKIKNATCFYFKLLTHFIHQKKIWHGTEVNRDTSPF